jgi:hypothetical protein
MHAVCSGLILNMQNIRLQIDQCMAYNAPAAPVPPAQRQSDDLHLLPTIRIDPNAGQYGDVMPPLKERHPQIAGIVANTAGHRRVFGAQQHNLHRHRLF